MNSIILASKSPRRQELMSRITRDFEVIVSDAEEYIPQGMPAAEVPVFLAAYKAGAVAQNHHDRIVIGADTVVILDGQVMGKPKDADDAARMLHALSGCEHIVVTGCCIIRGTHWVTFSKATRVRFYPLSDAEIVEYIATGEPFDKAGAYGIQGQGSLLVEGIDGDFFNVMGLPIAELKRELDAVCAG